ncbi:MAG: hypothetical protein R3C12_25725 [Planctomycetaceae bacterium]
MNEKFVIVLGIEAEQGQLETVLATGLAVAASPIAIQLGEHRYDLMTKTDRMIHIHSDNPQRTSRFRPQTGTNPDDSLTIGLRNDQTIAGDRCQIRRFNRPLDIARVIDKSIVSHFRGDEQLPSRVAAPQMQHPFVIIRQVRSDHQFVDCHRLRAGFTSQRRSGQQQAGEQKHPQAESSGDRVNREGFKSPALFPWAIYRVAGTRYHGNHPVHRRRLPSSRDIFSVRDDSKVLGGVISLRGKSAELVGAINFRWSATSRYQQA